MAVPGGRGERVRYSRAEDGRLDSESRIRACTDHRRFEPVDLRPADGGERVATFPEASPVPTLSS